LAQSYKKNADKKTKRLPKATPRLFEIIANYLFTIVLKSEPALNLTAFLAGMLIVSPVLGFFPFLAAQRKP
jgi:hypothetical protein